MNKRTIVVIGTVAAIVAIFLIWTNLFGYWKKSVDQSEIGIVMRKNVVLEAVGPGLYTDFDPFANLDIVSRQPKPFCFKDPQVSTQNLEQLISVMICGSFSNPPAKLTKDGPGYDYVSNYGECNRWWKNQNSITGTYSDDDVTLANTSSPLAANAAQAIKVCAGERSLVTATVGNTRNDLALCVDEQLSGSMASGFCGIIITGITAPEIGVPEEVVNSIERLGLSQSNTRLLDQQAEEARAEGRRALSERQAAVRTEQGTLQEQATQNALTLAAQAQEEIARKELITAQLENEKYEAGLTKSIREIDAQTALIMAEIDMADKIRFAKICKDYPEYCSFLVELESWKAVGGVDQAYFTDGIDPEVFLGNLPSLNVPNSSAETGQ